jgi:hypothetical protein
MTIIPRVFISWAHPVGKPSEATVSYRQDGCVYIRTFLHDKGEIRERMQFGERGCTYTCGRAFDKALRAYVRDELKRALAGTAPATHRLCFAS